MKVSLAGLCGSDLHPYEGREVGLDEGTTMGHELVGHIVQARSLSLRPICWQSAHRLCFRQLHCYFFVWLCQHLAELHVTTFRRAMLVLQVSEGVKGLSLGQRVVSAFTLSCSECWFCRQRLTCRCSHPDWGARVFGCAPGSHASRRQMCCSIPFVCASVRPG